MYPVFFGKAKITGPNNKPVPSQTTYRNRSRGDQVGMSYQQVSSKNIPIFGVVYSTYPSCEEEATSILNWFAIKLSISSTSYTKHGQ